MSTGWGTGQSATSSSLTLTSGNTYTLTITDDGTTVLAYMTDDAGPQSCSFTATLSTSNADVMVGWVGLSASYTFNAGITGVDIPTVATPTFSPGAGNYTSAQTVTISSDPNPAASIYYTTDGSAPTTSSAPYTGPISVSTSQTVKALAVLAGWANSTVGKATYTIPTVTPLAGGTGTSGSVTVSAGLLVVNVLSTAAITGVKYGGTTMSFAQQISPTGYTLAQYYLPVSAGTGAISITTSGTTAWNAANVLGLVHNSVDQESKAFGSSGTPDTGTTGTTTAAAEVAIGTFGLQYSSATWTWAGTPAFTNGAEDVTAGSYVTLTEGYTVLASTSTVDAALTIASGSTSWQGLVTTYS